MRRWGVLISGRGSNLGALIDARATHSLDLRLVVTSNPDALGCLRARRAGLPCELAPFIENTKKMDWMRLDSRLREERITHIFLAGFMKIVPPDFVSRWRGRILNLHPSLLPHYPGLRSIERAYRDRAAMGLTVHEVNAEVDAGRIVLRRRSLKAAEVGGYLLDSAEFLVHVDEQRAIKEAAARWTP